MASRRGVRWRAWLPRLLGLALLPAILTRLDLGRVRQALQTADVALVALAIVGTVPLILVKTVRWQALLRGQSIRLGLWPAFLAYFGSLFIGLLTPGRLGEFVKAGHVAQDCGVPLPVAFASVLVDRLFDLYALLMVGSAAVFALTSGATAALTLAGLVAVFVVPLALFLNDAAFRRLQGWGMRLGKIGERLLAEEGAVAGLRAGLCRLSRGRLLAAAALTAVAYGLFFGQCYLLALALGLRIGFGTVSVAVALGSLVALLPVSIAGLGTREAATIAYLRQAGMAGEAAVAFSLLVFVTFYLGSGLFGAIAWWLKPVGGGTSSVKREA